MTLVLGGPGAGKTTYLLDLYRRATFEAPVRLFTQDVNIDQALQGFYPPTGSHIRRFSATNPPPIISQVVHEVREYARGTWGIEVFPGLSLGALGELRAEASKKGSDVYFVWQTKRDFSGRYEDLPSSITPFFDRALLLERGQDRVIFEVYKGPRLTRFERI
jgi:hypothetical protein